MLGAGDENPLKTEGEMFGEMINSSAKVSQRTKERPHGKGTKADGQPLY